MLPVTSSRTIVSMVSRSPVESIARVEVEDSRTGYLAFTSPSIPYRIRHGTNYTDSRVPHRDVRIDQRGELDLSHHTPTSPPPLP